MDRIYFQLIVIFTLAVYTLPAASNNANNHDNNNTQHSAELYDHQTSHSVEESVNSHHSYGILQLPIAPNQKAWCKLVKIEQVLSYPGCHSKVSFDDNKLNIVRK